MNFNKGFVILISIVVAVVIISVLFANQLITDKFGFTQENFFLISSFLILLGIFLFWFFSYGIFEALFEKKNRLRSVVKKTLHELNTPVATIDINTKMLRKKIDDVKMLQKLDRIETACQNLLELYEQMEYSIKKEVHSVEHDYFNLHEAVERSLHKFEDIKGDITLINEVKPLFIKSDKHGFMRVLDNLISNAIKYNKKEGFVKIYTEGTKLIIKDSGIGIDTKNLFVVFDSYYQENSSNEGFGMGLAIVKEFCDTHKIGLNIDSSSQGSAFILDLTHLPQKGKA
ncbi:MAG: sensor histidine kinase [Campylobacterota bacterium]